MPTATQSIVEPRSYPIVTNETMELMRQQQRQLIAQGVQGKPAAELTTTKRYVFRTKPDTYRHLVHQIDVKPYVDPDDTSPDGQRRKFILSRWMLRHKADPAGDAERLQAIADAAGGAIISFTTIRGHQECWFETDDAQLAAYLRDLVTRRVGEFAQVLESNGTARVVAGDMAFPNTEMGWKAAREHAQTAGVADIKIVTED